MGKVIICLDCGQGYNPEHGGCWHCKDAASFSAKQRQQRQPKNLVNIPDGNIKTYRYWYRILTQISKMPYIEEDYDTPLTTLKTIQKQYNLDQEWLLVAYTPITRELNKRDNLLDPFREVKRLMVYGQATQEVPYSELYPKSPSLHGGTFKLRNYQTKKREGKGKCINWGFNVLLAAIVEDCHWWGKGKKFVESLQILENLDIPEAKDLEYDTLRLHYRGIDQTDLHTILEALHKACSAKHISFIPEGVEISEWPLDFFANIADFVGFKKNPYLSGEKHLADEMRDNLPPHLKKLLKNRK